MQLVSLSLSACDLSLRSSQSSFYVRAYYWIHTAERQESIRRRGSGRANLLFYQIGLTFYSVLIYDFGEGEHCFMPVRSFVLLSVPLEVSTLNGPNLMTDSSLLRFNHFWVLHANEFRTSAIGRIDESEFKSTWTCEWSDSAAVDQNSC